LTYGRQENARFLRAAFTTHERNYSERTSEEIDAEVRRISDELYSRAKNILTDRWPELERIAQVLITKETLDSQQLTQLLDSSKTNISLARLPDLPRQEYSSLTNLEKNGTPVLAV
jgi:cell division protease FtsH